MKKTKFLTIAACMALAFGASAVAGDKTDAILKEAMKVDVAKTCDPQKNSVTKLLAVAKKYNPTAVKLGVEFKRLGMTTTQYIQETQKALKAKSKTVTLLDKNGKPTDKKVSVDYAAERACKFAVRALQEYVDAQTTYKLAIPGEGYKY